VIGRQLGRAALAGAALALLSLAAIAGDLPDLALTPGKVCLTDVAKICATKWGKDARAVTAAMKTAVFGAYQVSPAKRHLANGKAAYEIDHLVSRELGGCDAAANLWPQPYTGAWNAHLKDRVENRLHVEVCAGRLSLSQAQREIVTDWRVPWRRYFAAPGSR
jgi:hypothetical protein